MFTITRDGQPITTVADQFALLRWFHRQHSYSIDHAVRYEGYAVLDEQGQQLAV